MLLLLNYSVMQLLDFSSSFTDKRCLRPSGTTSPVNTQHTSQTPQSSAVSKDLKPYSQIDFDFLYYHLKLCAVCLQY